MQRCPYIHEMKERLLGAPNDSEVPQAPPPPPPRDDPQVGTIVKWCLAGGSNHHRCPAMDDEISKAIPKKI
ncbi:Uncharacterized protein OBRU01_09596 [Operophtera brumata]|uniref:Uncharacterized protein n=1 Tax=Operophtera brumata TaxID=104452 RepID=A0A0L7LAK6_OPEBR|nr:Uncharacterized protein OBRU01_09596 [Operophtera brumata]